MMPGEHHVQGGAGGQLLYPPAKRQAFGGDFSQSRLQRSSTIRGTTPGGTPGTPLLTKLAMEAGVEFSIHNDCIIGFVEKSVYNRDHLVP